jgi:hypothetical protein
MNKFDDQLYEIFRLFYSFFLSPLYILFEIVVQFVFLKYYLFKNILKLFF